MAYQSPLHRRYTIETFNACFLPGIQLNQFRYYQKGDEPVGFVTWAWLTDDMAAKYQQGNFIPPPTEWNKGPNLWFIEFLAPFGNARAMIYDLRNGLLKEHIGYGLRRGTDGSVTGIKRWVGRDTLTATTGEQEMPA